MVFFPLKKSIYDYIISFVLLYPIKLYLVIEKFKISGLGITKCYIFRFGGSDRQILSNGLTRKDHLLSMDSGLRIKGSV